MRTSLGRRRTGGGRRGRGKDDDEEMEGEEGGNIGDDDNNEEGGTSLGVEPTNLFGEAMRIDFEQGGQDDGANIDGDAGVEILVLEEGGAVWAVEGVAATSSVLAASSCSVFTTGRGKRAGAQGSVGGGEEENCSPCGSPQSPH